MEDVFVIAVIGSLLINFLLIVILIMKDARIRLFEKRLESAKNDIENYKKLWNMSQNRYFDLIKRIEEENKNVLKKLEEWEGL